MIKIVPRLLSKKRDPIDNITIELANAITEGICKEIKPKWENVECELHPNHTSTIVIKALDGKSPAILKENFCCKEFEERFTLT